MTAPLPAAPRLTDRKRDAIIQAAIAEFRENGFNGTSMDRVAAVADVSKRTVYNHFPSKEELFEAILMRMWERSQAPDELAYTPDRPLRDQLLELLTQKMRLLNDASFIDLSRAAMADLMHSPERARAITAKLTAKEEGLSRWLRAAQQNGCLRPAMEVPYAAQQSTVKDVADALAGKILIDVTVPLVPPKVSRVQLPDGGSAVEAVQKMLGEGVRVVSAFQNISAHHLTKLDEEIECDVLVCADDSEAADQVVALAQEIGLRAWNAGPLCNSVVAEGLTSVLIALNRRYKVPGSGIRITGV